MAGEESVTRQVLQRKRNLAAGKTESPASAARKPAEYEPPARNMWINGTLLVLSLYLTTFKFIPELGETAIPPFLTWLPFVAIGLAIGALEFEEALLPPFVAAAVDSTLLVRNLGLSLANQGFMGAAEGAVIVFVHYKLDDPVELALPFVSVAIARLIHKFARRSLTLTECCLLATGLTNLLVWKGYLYQAILITGLLGFAPAYFLVPRLEALLRDRKKLHASQEKLNNLGLSIVLSYVATAGTLFFVYLYTIGPGVLEFAAYVADNLGVVAWWMSCLTPSFAVAFLATKRASLDTRRKLWHICALFMFLPTSHHPFTPAALAVAIIAFLFLEVVRSSGVPGIGLAIHEFLKSFIDFRDTRGPIIVSHIFLLLGVAAPIFAGNGSPVGAISLGLGDTLASQVGRRFGRHRWFGHKTLEGTVAFFVATLSGLLIAGRPLDVPTVAVAFAGALFEAVSPMNDNLVLPLYILGLERVLDSLWNRRRW